LGPPPILSVYTQGEVAIKGYTEYVPTFALKIIDMLVGGLTPSKKK
jgi:hypothetical protein